MKTKLLIALSVMFLFGVTTAVVYSITGNAPSAVENESVRICPTTGLPCDGGGDCGGGSKGGCGGGGCSHEAHETSTDIVQTAEKTGCSGCAGCPSGGVCPKKAAEIATETSCGGDCSGECLGKCP